MSEQIKIIEHLEALYGPRPLLRRFAEQLNEAHPTAPNARFDLPVRPESNAAAVRDRRRVS